MLIIDVIDGKSTKTVTIPTDWEDMTLNYWCGIHKIISKYRKKEEFAKNIGEKDSETPNLQQSTLDFLKQRDVIQMNKEIFQYVADVSKEDIDFVDLGEAMKVIGAMNIFNEEYEPKGLKSFEINGKTYLFPKENLLDNTFGDYIEATQLEMNIESLTNGYYEVLPEQMAILCREEDEEYDEERVAEKTEEFKKLTMDTVMEFSFFLTKRSLLLADTLEMYSVEKEEEGVV